MLLDKLEAICLIGYLPNFVYRVSANDRLAAPYIIQQAIKNHRRPAIFYQNSVWGRGNLSYMRDYLKAEDLQFVYEEMINRGAAVNFTQLLEAAKNQKQKSIAPNLVNMLQIYCIYNDF
jgi:ABC-type branched-subunit amino acid transport system substrate-binding protein